MAFFILLLATCVILFIFFRILSRRGNVVLSKAISNHNSLVCALTKRSFVDQNTKFSEEEERKIVSMTETDWKEWENLISQMKSYSIRNSPLMYDIVKDYFPTIFESSLFKKISSNSKTSKIEAAIRSLSFEEIRVIGSMTEDDWNKRRERLKKIDHIVNENPEGIKTYKDINKIQGILPNKILLQECSTIEYLQKLFVRANNLLGWEKRQNKFYIQYRDFVIECYSNAGYHYYNIPYKTIKRDGSYDTSSYYMYISFTDAYSKHHLDMQSDYWINKYKILPEIKDCTWYYYKHVYDNIFNIIKKIENVYEEKPLVVFINNSIYEWSKGTYDFHYRDLKSILDENEYVYTDIDILHNLTKEKDYSCVMLIGLITTNEELFTNCNLVLDFFKDKIPVICYHSFIKEYSEKEIINVIKKEEKETKSQEGADTPSPTPLNPSDNNEESDILFVKELFLQVNKHNYYSYFAIINTLIGSAYKSDEVKTAWLGNHIAIHADGSVKNNNIQFEYSINNSPNKVFAISGNRNSIDDISRFSCLFLKEIGLWKQFKTNGIRGIRKINDLGFLAYH